MKFLLALWMIILGGNCLAQPAWRKVASYPSSDARSIVVLPNVGVAIATSQDGVLFSSDGLASWRYCGLKEIPVSEVVAMGRDSLLALTMDPGVVCRSRAGDTTWECLKIRGADVPLRAVVATERYLFAAESKQLWRTRRDSIAWERILRPLPSIMFQCVAAYDDGLVVVGGMKIVVSKDEGRTWDTGLVTGAGNLAMDLMRRSKSDLLCILNGSLATSRDGGTSFSLRWEALLEGSSDLALSDSGELWSAVGYRGVARSSDEGATWVLVNDGLLFGATSVAAMGTLILAGSDREGLFALETAAGIEQQSGTSSMSIHPVPAIDEVQIDIGQTQMTPLTLYVVDAAGGVRLRKKFDIGVRQLRVSTVGLSSGVYQVLIATGQQFLRGRLVVAH